MSRYLVSLPQNFVYAINYRVLYSDINAANHLGADRILPIALEAQLSFIKHLGYDDAIIFEDIGLIMVNSQIDYLSETQYGAQLRVDMAVEYVSDKAIDLIYRLWNTTTDKETARVKARMLFFDYQNEKPATIPESFRDAVANLKAL